MAEFISSNKDFIKKSHENIGVYNSRGYSSDCG